MQIGLTSGYEVINFHLHSFNSSMQMDGHENVCDSTRQW